MYRYLPDYISQGIFDIDYDKLYEIGIRGLCFDIDNTLIEMYNHNIHSKAHSLINKLKVKGFVICISSNASKKRTSSIADDLGLKYVYRAFKPSRKGFERVLSILNLPACKCAMIGDQLFTDIKGGKKMGFITVFTKKIDDNESLNVRIKRIFEKLIFRKYGKRIEKI